MTVTKEQMLFHLKRRLRNLETDEPDHVSMAQARMSYVDRAEHLKDVEEEKEKRAIELACYERIIALIEEHA